MTAAAPFAAPPLAPGAMGWGLATGLSVSLHVLLAATGVLAIAYTPPAAPPGSQTDIVVQSIPLVAGGGPQTAPRLGSLAPEQRQAGTTDAARLQPESGSITGTETARAASLAALTPEPSTPPAQAAETLQSVTPRQVQPSNPALEQPAPTTATRVAPISPAMPNPAESVVQPMRPMTPRALSPTQAAPVAAAQSAARPLAPSAPPERASSQDAAVTAPESTARALSPAPQSPRAIAPTAQVSAASTGPSGPSTLPAPQATAPRATREDSLLLALRARPERTLGDRRAAPRLPDPPGGGLQAPAPENAQATDQDLYAQVLSYLRSLPDIDCFAALPALGADGLLRFEVFGPAATGLDAFRAGLEDETGLIPAMVLRPISEGQCNTLDFVRATPDYPATGLYFELDSRVIASGSQLSGRMAGRSADQGALHLLLVDNAGRVQILDRFLDANGRFAIPMTLQGGEVQTWQLLMAVSVPERIDLLRGLDGPQAAGPLFSALSNAMQRIGLRPGVALMAFGLQG
ncbi:hypothetical protein M3N55_10655 [Roseibaca sp. V10]|uniref:Serine/threonine protein kinase n=1 Tax=Roseinatronobacter domitianus TaxID=2940293 RepID=A0ABT0M2X5_9RHOB|nr:hypothetical protein [Roseibaca domitiana]MCL1629193.1 hypothetical protein [Roseibaca domitiana]